MLTSLFASKIRPSICYSSVYFIICFLTEVAVWLRNYSDLNYSSTVYCASRKPARLLDMLNVKNSEKDNQFALTELTPPLFLKAAAMQTENWKLFPINKRLIKAFWVCGFISTELLKVSIDYFLKFKPCDLKVQLERNRRSLTLLVDYVWCLCIARKSA